jgi:hypothetical protein
VALQHWDCSDDHIDPARIGSYSKREDASRLGHLFERAFNGSPEAMFMLYLNDTRVHGLVMEALRHFKGYKAIETKGI